MAPVAALMRFAAALALAVLPPVAAVGHVRGTAGADHQRSLLQTWGRALGSGSAGSNGGATARDTPITRVVILLKEMQSTLTKEMNEDAELYGKVSCWCNTNEQEKDSASSGSSAKISDLEASIKSLSARSAELQGDIKDLEAEVASGKADLAQATELREKQAKEFQKSSTGSIQAIEQLKAAIEVLAKHHGSALPQISFLALHGGKEEPWTENRDVYKIAQSLDDFMRQNGFDVSPEKQAVPDVSAGHKFLQQDAARSSIFASSSWSPEDTNVLRRAMKKAKAFMQAHEGEEYYPSYTAQSGEIVGLLKQIKEEMEGDLSEEEKLEASRLAAFKELSTAKTEEIRTGEAWAEKKEDRLAATNSDLAEAKEDLQQEQAAFNESQKFLVNLKATCEEASKNFEERKQARTDEIKAVSETISILMQDAARDTFSRTFSFVQLAASSGVRHDRERRSKAAAALRRAAVATDDPQLSVLATTVELDAFTRVKQAIDKMVAMLKVEQADEVKKSDWCNQELHGNELATAKIEDRKSDLETKEAALESNIKALDNHIAEAKTQIAQLQLSLQRSSEDRLLENREFQKTIADQAMTVSLLKTALERLSKYYEEAALVQRRKAQQAVRQTPPVAQADYQPSSGSVGVIQMIQKLVGEAQALMADSKRAENEAQVAYEQHIVDTNASIKGLSKQIATKTMAKADADKEKVGTGEDITATVKEWEGLSKTAIQLHAECDFLLKNLQVRQDGRSQEIEALQQAKQILSGAALS